MTVETVYKGNAERLVQRVPAAHLVTRGYFETERDKIFRRSWLLVGRADEVPELGSYVAREIPTMNTALLIVRGHDDKIRVFHNVCTHRGNKLVPEGAGCKKRFNCGFHGWIFSPEGACEVITQETQFRNLDKSILGLKRVHSDVWNGHIFVNFDHTPRQTLRDWLDPMTDQYDGYFEQHVPMNARRIEVKCNWNLALNAFIEGYHTLFLHARSVPDYQGGAGNPDRHRPFMEMFDRHQRYSAPANPNHKWTPAEAVAWRYGRQMLPAFDGDLKGMPEGINPGRANNWAFDVVQFFPNTIMIYGNHWHLEMTFWPIDADTTLIYGANHMYKAKNLGERLSQEFALSRARIVVREDLSTLEAQHAALKSGALSHFQLSQQEIAVQHHYRALNDMLAEA
jgi:phenylpropionate dioxygenase-like ring-hydroxylating dioxygenase large terminal subunit